MKGKEQLAHEIFDFELGYVCDATIFAGFSQNFVALKCLAAGIRLLKHLGMNKKELLETVEKFYDEDFIGSQ